MKRAYSLLQVKSLDEDQRIIEGIASTPTTDRMGDIVDPLGAIFKLPIPLLWQHDDQQPVGNVTHVKATPDGIVIQAKLEKADKSRKLNERLELAWESIKKGLVRGLSIGFSPLKMEPIDHSYGCKYSKWDWLELSAVTIPANSEATIQLIKSLDKNALAASGKDALIVNKNIKSSGVSEKKESITKRRAAMADQTTRERLEEFETKRKNIAALMDGIMKKANDEGTTLDAQQIEEYDNYKAEHTALVKHIKRLKKHQKIMVKKAKRVSPHNIKTISAGSKARGQSKVKGGPVVQVRKKLPKGTTMARYVQALAISKGSLRDAAEFSKNWRESTPEVEHILKSAVSAGTTTNPQWAGALVEYQHMVSEFIELLRADTILDRIPGLRNVPFNIKVPGQTSPSVANWVGEQKPIPVSQLGFDTTELGSAKAAGLVAFTNELMRSSNPKVEGLIINDLRDTMSGFLDVQFIDPSKAAVADQNPASVTHDAMKVESSGIDSDAVELDIQNLFKKFIDKNIPVSKGIWVMSSNTALTLSDMKNPLGQKIYPDITMNGGTLKGLEVITSQNVPRTSDGDIMVLMIPSEILLADDELITFDSSGEAAIEISGTPGSDGTKLISLWQRGMIAVRAIRHINWKPRRLEAVGYISKVNYKSSNSMNFNFDINCDCDHAAGGGNG